MGLNDESVIPEEYYCEKCRPDFHKIVKSLNLYVSYSQSLTAVCAGARTVARIGQQILQEENVSC